MRHVQAHHESTAETRLLHASVDGLSFAEILPRSIVISVVTMLKTWIELVYSAREAGISVRTKAAQLWNVGHGLPLDALKKGSFAEWSCSHHLSNGEVMPLLDALIKNSSLTRLHLAKAGLEWTGPAARRERSGAPLIEAMVASPAACSELRALIVGPSGFAIPVGRLRKGASAAREALRELRLLSASGPWRLEITLIADLLRSNRRTAAAASIEVRGSAAAVAALIEAAERGELGRAQWEAALVDMMAGGETRRAHLQALLGARLLRDVGFGARELLSCGFGADELYAGGFEAAELLASGYSHAALHALGYTPRGLKRAGLRAAELKRLGCSAASLRAADFSAEALLEAGYPLAQVWEAGYAPAELLRGGACTVAQLRGVGVPATALRPCLKPEPKLELIPQAHRQGDRAAVADALRAASSGDARSQTLTLTMPGLREGGYTAAELHAGGFECKQVLQGAYAAAEATKAGYTVAQLVSAGYGTRELRRAGHSARALKEQGLSLAELRQAEYAPAELSLARHGALPRSPRRPPSLTTAPSLAHHGALPCSPRRPPLHAQVHTSRALRGGLRCH